MSKLLLRIYWYKNTDLLWNGISNKSMIFRSDRKNGGISPFGRKRSCLLIYKLPTKYTTKGLKDLTVKKHT